LGPNVVVVEDDVSLGRAIGRLLRASGFQSQTFASAEELLETDAAAGAACLILDIQLPGLSGFDLHQRLIDAGIESPVIFITAYDKPTTRIRGENTGFAYLTKPFLGKSLMDSVTRAICWER
jgi:FixJ family two-component response regulator